MLRVLIYLVFFILTGCDNSSKEIYLTNEPGAWPHCPNDYACRDLHRAHEQPDAPDNEYSAKPIFYFLENGQHQAKAIFLPVLNSYFSDITLSQGKVYAVGGSGLTIAQSDGDITSPWRVKHFSRFGDAFRGIAVAGTKSDRLFATGTNGVIFRTQNAGKSWEEFNMTFWQDNSLPKDKQREELRNRITPYKFEGESYDIAFANDNIGIIVGYNNILRTADGGQSWHPVKKPEMIKNMAWQGVAFSSTQQAWVVGSGGRIMRSLDGGKEWAEFPLDTQKTQLISVSFADESHGCIVGDSGRTWCTSNGGTDWYQGDITNRSMLTKIIMRNSNEAWAVNRHGDIYRTQDGGKHWQLWMNVTEASKGNITYADFWGLAFDDKQGWAVGIAEHASDQNKSTTSPVIISWIMP